MVKNELKLGGLVAAYEKKKQAVEDLTDRWISALRRKATIKRKQVRPHSFPGLPLFPPHSCSRNLCC